MVYPIIDSDIFQTNKMEIVNIIFTYITVGVLFCLAIDYAYMQKDRGHFAYQHMPEKGITNGERIYPQLVPQYHGAGTSSLCSP